MLYVPGPKVLWMVAVPAADPDVIIHALPKMAGPSQYVALALQKITWPAVTGALFETTEAVTVTALPVVALLDDKVRVVVVVALGCAWLMGATSKISSIPHRGRRRRKFAKKSIMPFLLRPPSNPKPRVHNDG